MFPYYFTYNEKDCFDYYGKFFKEGFDDRGAYYRYKAEEYHNLLQQCGFFSHDINEEHNYCIYKPRKIIEDWAMVLGINPDYIDYHVLDGKILLYIKPERMLWLPENEKDRKQIIFTELGFKFPPFPKYIQEGRKELYDFFLESACSKIVTNFDIAGIKDIFEKLGINFKHKINWDLYNKIYLATRYNTFIFSGGNYKDENTKKLLALTFGSLDKAEKIRNKFWRKRYPDEVATIEEYQYYKFKLSEVRTFFKDNEIFFAEMDKSVNACFATLMIYRDRFEFTQKPNLESQYLDDSRKIHTLANLIGELESYPVNFWGKHFSVLDIEYVKKIVSEEIESLVNIFYRDKNDLLKSYYNNNFHYAIRLYFEINGNSVPSKWKYMIGFTYNSLLNVIDWKDGVGEQKKSLLIYQLGNIVGMPRHSNEDDNLIHKYVKREIDKYKKEQILKHCLD